MLQHMTRKRCLPAPKALPGPTTASQAHGSDFAKNSKKPERLPLGLRPKDCATQWQLGLGRLEETSATFRICLLRIRRSWACTTLRTQLWLVRTERQCRSGKGNMSAALRNQKCQTRLKNCQTLTRRTSRMPKNQLNFRELNGARGRNRTTDTRIFNPLLYP